MHVEIWSDIACPWCYVGKRRFEAALGSFEHRDEVAVTWRSFELDPEAPREREGDRAARLAEKYGVTVDEARAMQQRLTDVAAGEGLDFHFERARSGNTFDGHRLLHLAAAHGVQAEAKERLMRAYLTEGELVADPGLLERVGVEAGIPSEEVREVVAGDRYGDAVRADERTAMSLGISAVPFFVVDRTLGAAGAQPAEILAEVLRRGWEQRTPLAVVAEGAACDADGC